MAQTPGLFGSNRQYERWRWQVFCITWLAYAAFYLTRKSFTVAKISIGDPTVLGLTSSQMSWVDGAELATYAIGQFIWGIAGDRYGTRRIITFGMIASILATVGMGLSSHLWALIAFSTMQGFAQSTAWAPLSKNIGNFFSQHERGTVMGLWCTSYTMGGFIASLFDGYFGGHFGWRYAFFAPSLVMFTVWLLFLWLQRNRPEDVGLPSIEEYHGEPEAVVEKQTGTPDETEGSWKLIVEVLESPMVLLLSVSYFFMKLARYGLLLWTPLYLSEKLSTGMSASGALGGLFELAGLISVFLAGVASDKLLGSRRNPITIIFSSLPPSCFGPSTACRTHAWPSATPCSGLAFYCFLLTHSSAPCSVASCPDSSMAIGVGTPFSPCLPPHCFCPLSCCYPSGMHFLSPLPTSSAKASSLPQNLAWIRFGNLFAGASSLIPPSTETTSDFKIVSW